ncbi:unnamed protein product [Toxocara canis]|uniref:Uncharacterized protein n=1 Tax=Toxocara canis TaxID=6265 RepID=A0A3P7F2G6_TOXCA|nr:unnamed protein product [Toxocara canis]
MELAFATCLASQRDAVKPGPELQIMRSFEVMRPKWTEIAAAVSAGRVYSAFALLFFFQLRAESSKQPNVDLEGVFRPLPFSDLKQPVDSAAVPERSGKECEEQEFDESMNEANTLEEETNVGEEIDACIESAGEKMLQKADAIQTDHSSIEQVDSGSSSATKEEINVRIAFKIIDAIEKWQDGV